MDLRQEVVVGPSIHYALCDNRDGVWPDQLQQWVQRHGAKAKRMCAVPLVVEVVLTCDLPTCKSVAVLKLQASKLQLIERLLWDCQGETANVNGTFSAENCLLWVIIAQKLTR